MDFKSLHQKEQPLLIGNVWDAPSAKVFEKLNFNAIATSSAAIANMLGYEDGEQLSFLELEYIVKRIISATSLPLSVDIESGYSRDSAIVVENIARLYHIGVVGINIEDSFIKDNRQLVNANEFQKIIFEIHQHFSKLKMDIFINVRTDTFLLHVPNALEETLKRIAIYEKAGADGIFVPGIEKASDILAVVAATSLPINVMCMPNLPDFKALKNLGVKRISMGNFLHHSVCRQLEQNIFTVTQQQSFNSIFKSCL